MNERPPEPPVDNRSPHAKAAAMVSRITTMAFMLVLPALGGYFLDQKFNTTALFLFIGMLLGMFAAGWQLMKVVKSNGKVNDVRE